MSGVLCFICGGFGWLQKGRMSIRDYRLRPSRFLPCFACNGRGLVSPAARDTDRQLFARPAVSPEAPHA